MSKTQLVGDVGGTNARFALLDELALPVAPRTLRTDDFPSLGAAIGTYLKEQEINTVDAAAIAVATPVTGDSVKLTNNHWSFSIEETRRQLGMDRLHVINDFTALALSVRHLPDEELIKIGGGDPVADHAIAVIGPGTGLGVSGLIPCGAHWNALQGEGGHVSLGVRTVREIAVYEILMKKFRHVSAERFLSGPGLVNVVAALREIDGFKPLELSPAEVTQLGMTNFNANVPQAGSAIHSQNDTDALPDTLAVSASVAGPEDIASCEEALNMFCELLGSCAGNLVLTLGAEGGVYIGGGVVPRLGEFFAQSHFRREFEAKGRMQAYLEKVPSYVIHSKYPALVGAAQLLV